MHSVSLSGDQGWGKIICKFVSPSGHLANLFYHHFISFDSVAETKTIFPGTSEILLCNIDIPERKESIYLHFLSFPSFSCFQRFG